MAGSKMAVVVVVVLAVAACWGVTVQGASLRLDQAQMSLGSVVQSGKSEPKKVYYNRNFKERPLKGCDKDRGWRLFGGLCYAPCKEGYYRKGMYCCLDGYTECY
jgi:hypothetical protein